MLDWSVKSRRNLTLDFCKCAQTSLPSGVDDNRRNFTHCIICSHRWCQCIIKPTVYLDTVWWRPGCLSVWVAQMTVFSSAILWAVVFLLFSLLSVSYQRVSDATELDHFHYNQQKGVYNFWHLISNTVWTVFGAFCKEKQMTSFHLHSRSAIQPCYLSYCEKS